MSEQQSFDGTRVVKAFADGGVIGVNPSPLGGTWAVIYVDDQDQEIARFSGVITPLQMGLQTVSNNVSELYACLEAMKRLPDGWKGILHTDSGVTVCRLVNASPGMKGIPQAGIDATFRQRERLRGMRVVLLDGHPNKAQLASGVGKRGYPTSKWNVECDRECNRLATEFRTAATLAGDDNGRDVT